MFEVTGTVNEENLRKIKKHLIGDKQKNIFIVGVVIIALVGVIIFDMNSIAASVCFITSAVLVVYYFYIINKACKLCVARIEESSGKRENTYKIFLKEHNMLINNLDTKSEVHIKYDVFVKFVEASDLYVMITKNYQFFILNKNCLESEQVDEFEMFIQNKCKNLV